MESIHPRSDRSGSSDDRQWSPTTRRTGRSSSVASPTSLTNPTTAYQDSDNGRLGSRFSILKPTAPNNQTLHASLPKVLSLPPWLQDTITELDASHPLRAVFPTFHDLSDPAAVHNSPENPPDYQIPRTDANQPFCFPSTPRAPPLARPRDSDTSPDEPQAFSAPYLLYHDDSLLNLQPETPTPSANAPSHSELAFPTASNYRPSSSTFTNVTKPAHIRRFETTLLSASSSNHTLHDPASPASQQDSECDGIFRYDPSQADFTPVLPPPPPRPFVFEKPAQIYFDSPIEDPISSDPSEPGDYHDPFKLDPEEYKKLSFKWAPFDSRTGMKGGLRSGKPETSAERPEEVSGDHLGDPHLALQLHRD